jgi:tryptophan-rich sensory protein
MVCYQQTGERQLPDIYSWTNRRSSAGFLVYVGSLMLNAGWSWLFFGRRRMDLALIDVALLWLSLATVMALFWAVRPFAALLVAPYLLWVTIAAFLNLRMIQLNPPAQRA